MGNLIKTAKVLLHITLIICEYILKFLILFMPICTILLICGYIFKNDSGDNLWTNIFKLSSYLLLLLLVFGHVLNTVVANTNNGYNKITIFFLSRNQTLFSYLTFGLFNTFLLELYYSVKRPGVSGDFTSLLILFPLVNISVYILFFHSLRKRGFKFSPYKLAGL